MELWAEILPLRTQHHPPCPTWNEPFSAHSLWGAPDAWNLFKISPGASGLQLG